MNSESSYPPDLRDSGGRLRPSTPRTQARPAWMVCGCGSTGNLGGNASLVSGVPVTPTTMPAPASNAPRRPPDPRSGGHSALDVDRLKVAKRQPRHVAVALNALPWPRVGIPPRHLSAFQYGSSIASDLPSSTCTVSLRLARQCTRTHRLGSRVHPPLTHWKIRCSQTPPAVFPAVSNAAWRPKTPQN